MSLDLPLSRRNLLAGATAVGLTAAGAVGADAGFLAARAAGSPPLVTPQWSEKLRTGYGVNASPNFLASGNVYAGTGAWLGYLRDLGVGYLRGFYSPSLSSTQKVIDACRAHGIKWVMLVVPEDWGLSTAGLKNVLGHIRDHAADVCLAIEGPNEPNHNRDGSPVKSGWPALTVSYQKVIHHFVTSTPALSHVTVIGPSLQIGASDPYPDFVKLANAGVAKYMDIAGMHSYPGGYEPDNNLDKRMGWAKSAFGKKTWVTETGYTNAMAARSGHRPVPTDVSTTYAPRSLLEAARRGCKVSRFEMLDDPDARNSKQEANFGLLTCPSTSPATWRVKPEYTRLKSFLGGLRDTAKSYSPPAVPLAVDAPAAVHWATVGRSDGSARVLIYQNSRIYDPVKRVRLSPASSKVTITDRVGSRVFQIGPEVTSVALR